MPTEAFYKLESSKKEQILAAAIREFSELPYEKVSIFKIAQNADVSRSGFYYYFKDKRDIYEYLIQNLKNDFLRINDIKNKTFDVFWLGERIFDFIVSFKGTKQEAFFRRVVSNMKADDLKVVFSFVDNPRACSDVNCSTDGMKLDSPEQLKGMIMFLATSIMYAAGGYMDDQYSLEDSRSKLHDMFDIIKHGIIKGV